ncbi:site-specific DNA-methyltransferase [Pseudomonas tritici]|uniref:site-specific DNA-methyltransferase n=1 Tax=Pseudomonas tritici TaxID=2745518 RepID=UPI00387B15BC
MDKLKMHSPNLTEANIDKLAAMFPNCITEARDAAGELKRAIDFDLLRQEMSTSIVEGQQERYQLNWPGKREALLTANAPIAKTLRPHKTESVDFDTTQNLFIEGDNLDALKLLQENYLNKVKMIYIDPPYNTGNDFIYNDNFSESSEGFLSRSLQKDSDGGRLVANLESNGRFHSDWISMIYSRLKLARNLLRDDGIIFISIDDGEVANLRRCCDEIFGENNFIAQIAWEKRYTRSNNARRFYSLKDNILVFRKSEKLDEIKEARTEKADSSYRNPDNDPKGLWTTSSYVNPATKEARPNLVYGISNPFTKAVVHHPTHAWKFGLSEHKAHVDSGRLWWGSDGSAEYPRLKIYLSEQTGGMVPIDLWDYKSSGTTDEGGGEIKSLFGAAVFDTPKPTKLVRRMLGISTGVANNDIVLDFFAGSCSTAAAVMLQNSEDGGNRRSISVQMAESCAKGSVAEAEGFSSIAEISKERMRRAGAEILKAQCHASWNKDVGFRVLKIDTSNMKEVYYTPDAVSQDLLSEQVDNIREDRTAEDLLFQVLLDWGVDLALPISQQVISGKTVFFVDGNALAACFDTGIDEDFVKQLAGHKPLRVVFRDAGFASDSVKINVEQVFKLLSPATEIKTL